MKRIKTIGIGILSLIVIFFLARWIGMGVNRRTPSGGINKSMYVDINGDIDYQTNYPLACEYFEKVDAPKKQMFVMKDATHGLLESRSEEFSGFLHQIAARIRLAVRDRPCWTGW